MVLFGALFAKKKFDIHERALINNFIKRAISDFDKKRSLSFNYDISGDREEKLPTYYKIERGNAAAEKWRDRIGTDTFVMTDRVRYTILKKEKFKKEKEIDTISFCKFLAERNTESNLVTIQVHLRNRRMSTHRFEEGFSSEFGIRLYQGSNNYIESIYNKDGSIKQNIGYPEFKYSKSLSKLMKKEKKMSPVKKALIEDELQRHINKSGHGMDDVKVFFDEKRKEVIKLLKKKTKTSYPVFYF
tara:strand:- start:244 stop:975 length:732 start_codon:yes stop_codon:yes gene_type:complete